MLEQISKTLSTFHFFSHLSFVITSHYPRIRHSPYYDVLGVTDMIAHLLAARRGYILAKIMMVWHILKGYVPRYRSYALMNTIDCLAHGQASIPFYQVEGFVLYVALRVLDLVW